MIAKLQNLMKNMNMWRKVLQCFASNRKSFIPTEISKSITFLHVSIVLQNSTKNNNQQIPPYQKKEQISENCLAIDFPYIIRFSRIWIFQNVIFECKQCKEFSISPKAKPFQQHSENLHPFQLFAYFSYIQRFSIKADEKEQEENLFWLWHKTERHSIQFPSCL
jgi:hypothetical protein